MKKKHVIFYFLYYALTIVVYMAFFYAASLMLDLTGKADNLGSDELWQMEMARQ